MEKHKTLLMTAALVVLALIGRVLLNSPATAGTPMEIEILGSTIRPGETTVDDLYAEGFQLSDIQSRQFDFNAGTSWYNCYSPGIMTEGYTEYLGLLLIKDDEQVAAVDVVNENRSSQKLGACKVSEIAIYSVDEEDMERCVVEGIPLKDLTLEKLTEVKGEPSGQWDIETEDGTELHTTWSSKKYSLEIKSIQEDGRITTVSLEYDAGK